MRLTVTCVARRTELKIGYEAQMEGWSKTAPDAYHFASLHVIVYEIDHGRFPILVARLLAFL